jgi:anti-sigma factor (TIGR02949 family)
MNRPDDLPDRGPGDMTCADVVELVSDYLDGNLPESEAERVAVHLVGCPGCQAYFEQVRATSAGVREVEADDLPPDLRAKLLEAFRKSEQ